MKTRWVVACAALMMGGVFGVINAQASTYDFTSDHCTGTCGTAPFAIATVTQDGNNTLLFDISLINAQSMVNTGFPLTFAFNLSGGPTITYSNLTSGFSIPDVIGTNQQAAGSYHQDGTGFFQYGVLWHLNGGGAGYTGTLSFDISASGLTLASLVQNSNNQFFALDVLGSNGNTGNVDASFLSEHNVEVTPLPPAALMFGTALVGLGILVRRRRGLAQA